MKPNLFQQHILPFLSFMKRPQYTIGKTDNSVTRIVGTLILFVLLIIWNNLISLWDISSLIGADIGKLKDFHDPLDWRSNVFLMIVLAPVSEEFICRGYLKSVVGSFVFYASVLLLLLIFFINQQVSFHYRITIAVIFVFLLITFILICYPKVKKEYIFKTLLIRYYPYHIWVSTILFSLMHLFNYNYHSVAAILLSPLLTLPQLFGGITLAYVRVRYGLAYSILLHAMNNGFYLASIYFFS